MCYFSSGLRFTVAAPPVASLGCVCVCMYLCMCEFVYVVGAIVVIFFMGGRLDVTAEAKCYVHLYKRIHSSSIYLISTVG